MTRSSELYRAICIKGWFLRGYWKIDCSERFIQRTHRCEIVRSLISLAEIMFVTVSLCIDTIQHDVSWTYENSSREEFLVQVWRERPFCLRFSRMRYVQRSGSLLMESRKWRCVTEKYVTSKTHRKDRSLCLLSACVYSCFISSVKEMWGRR